MTAHGRGGDSSRERQRRASTGAPRGLQENTHVARPFCTSPGVHRPSEPGRQDLVRVAVAPPVVRCPPDRGKLSLRSVHLSTCQRDVSTTPPTSLVGPNDGREWT